MHNRKITQYLHITPNITPFDTKNICFMCFGTGELKTMKMVQTYDAGALSVEGEKVRCNHCGGTGRSKK